jgi:hypothetical protein
MRPRAHVRPETLEAFRMIDADGNLPLAGRRVSHKFVTRQLRTGAPKSTRIARFSTQPTTIYSDGGKQNTVLCPVYLTYVSEDRNASIFRNKA